ncbi:NiFe-hydrogenase I small subunit HyaA [Methanonatronarchaeum thermophilum]|uniref:NiFe-hydrogenase I small subunit HyaA n=1 Tax=Methanonatronarchaeum thermophilum TaxID=1927129 RepID=A0A1Y3GCH0_9EURY|nr:hydrogenase small subunit [Methanonatronarchaeum thermophilum]OUJ18947.1 NiFe-hydrogenase I small subunit HyaA [Methanonatronarchaeum thermophilum]
MKEDIDSQLVNHKVEDEDGINLENIDLMDISRRSFLKLAALTGAATFIGHYSTDIVEAINDEATPKVVWLQGADCTGCTISFLNSEEPTVAQAIMGIGDYNVDLGYHETIGYQFGITVDGEPVEEEYNANYALDQILEEEEEYILILEGSVQEAMNGNYCRSDGEAFIDKLEKVAENAQISIALGACACWGGIPGAEGGNTGAVGLQFDGKKLGGFLGEDYESQLGYPVVNVPGCPVHPHWLMTVVVAALLDKLPAPEDIGGWVDDYHRPLDIYGTIEHDYCTLRGFYGNGVFAETYGEEGCLWKIGCKAPVTYANCPKEKWHRGTTYCMQALGPCVACTEPDFPEAFQPFREPVQRLPSLLGFDLNDFVKVAGAVTAVGIAAHAIRRVAMGEKEQE